jgi:hypothetical protein
MYLIYIQISLLSIPKCGYFRVNIKTLSMISPSRGVLDVFHNPVGCRRL